MNEMDIERFTQRLKAPDFQFEETLAFIEQHYFFKPTAFTNGAVQNSAEQNQGSCKVLALAELLELTQQQTLQCFGQHYRDVLATPNADNHFNLRRIQQEGLSNIRFEQFPLLQKEIHA